ncbi:MAG TPA: hypothetical protein VFV31_04740 [Chitinophagaceae bacterium]|nr:hypothetical protein [Chitinophagaceae bacterium]
MKKVLLFFILSLTVNLISASPFVLKPKKKIYASDIMIPLGETGTKVSLLDISKITIKEAELIRGDKMKFSEKLAFKAAQRKLNQYINNDGSLNDQRIVKNLKKVDGNGGFHAGGFFLGLLLGLIGLIIALLINDEKKKSRIKWALIGWGIWIAIVLVATLA